MENVEENEEKWNMEGGNLGKKEIGKEEKNKKLKVKRMEKTRGFFFFFFLLLTFRKQLKLLRGLPKGKFLKGNS